MTKYSIQKFVEQARAQADLARGHLPNQEILNQFNLLSEQLRANSWSDGLSEAIGPLSQISEILRVNQLVVPAIDTTPIGDIIRQLHESFGYGEVADLIRQSSQTSELFARAIEGARFAEAIALPAPLLDFRIPADELITRLSLSGPNWPMEEGHMRAFAETSALAQAMRESMGVGSALQEAMKALTQSVIPAFETLRSYGQFLNAAGLDLPHWPKFRLLTMAEKRRRLKARKEGNAQPPHVKRANSLVYKHEITLREIIDAVMASAYGEDWPEQRLPLCGCKDLLGKWKARGGGVLEHADYAHYARIMSNSEHFTAIFAAGFNDPDALAALLLRAGALRAQSHHARPFTMEDLRDLRMTWRALERGLLPLTPDHAVEFDA